ncbi:hypothetical protein IHC92_18090 [Photobacterium damselae subsp. damselae]|uniref:hypothetical protein n=1 Tax=Photobacterium damselae TaxID=38293 RepID=UPI001F404BA6|nr:hypothetical protein [Photobacterium damselae]UKA08723.1 hypothetical protein IHC90_17080 [Photobacterium damselae subsp. damselae]UKA22880.1 hypothetical protein IHC92_18090 [Photobacterium damselae subsp. damselae]
MLKSILTIGLLSASVSAFANPGLSTTCSNNNTWHLNTGENTKSMRLDFVGRSSVMAEDMAFSVFLDLDQKPNFQGYKTLYSTLGDLVIANINKESFKITVPDYADLIMTQTPSGMKVTVDPTYVSWVQGCFTTLKW